MRLGSQFTRWSKDIPQNAPFRYIDQQFRCARAVDAIREFGDECVAFHFCFLPNRFRMKHRSSELVFRPSPILLGCQGRSLNALRGDPKAPQGLAQLPSALEYARFDGGDRDTHAFSRFSARELTEFS